MHSLAAVAAACHQHYKNAKAVGLSVEVEYIADLQKIMECG